MADYIARKVNLMTDPKKAIIIANVMLSVPSCRNETYLDNFIPLRSSDGAREPRPASCTIYEGGVSIFPISSAWRIPNR